ncbi:MAG: hypothetical protein R6W70_03075 [bacterium]
MKKHNENRRKTIVEKFLEKAPLSQELRYLLEDNSELPKQISKDIYAQIMSGSGKLKSEVSEMMARKFEEHLRSYDIKELIKEVLENYDLNVNISFSRKKDE